LKIYELKVSLEVRYPLHFQKSLEPLSKLLATVLVEGGMAALHQKQGFKHYVFTNLHHLSSSKSYPKGENTFTINTPKEELARFFAKELLFRKDSFFDVKGVEVKVVEPKRIDALMSLNPVVVSFVKDGKRNYWSIDRDGDIDYLLRTLHNNLVKKYADLYGEKLEGESFIEFFEIKNKKPIATYYKNGKVIGNKFFIRPKQDSTSQRLAFIALASGLGEKNSLGFGYMRGYGKL